jgi:O-antigen ligase
MTIVHTHANLSSHRPLRLLDLGALIGLISILLLQAPNLVTTRGLLGAVIKAAPLIVIFAAAMILALRPILFSQPRGSSVAYSGSVIGLIFIVSEIVGASRGYASGALKAHSAAYDCLLLVAVWLFVRGVVGVDRGSRQRVHACMLAVCFSAVLYVTVNIVALFVGIHGEARGSAIMLRTLGIDWERTHFLLSDGWNSFGVLAGASMLVGMVLLHYRWSLAIIGIAVAVIGGLGILLVDSRGALVSVVIVLIVTAILLRVRPRLLVLVPVLAPMAVPIVIALLFLYDPTLILGIFARDGEEESLASGRIAIWGLGIDALMRDPLGFLVGYGTYGSRVVGLDPIIASELVLSDEQAEGLTMHNGYIQYVMDRGVIGLGILVAFQVRVFQSLVLEASNSKSLPIYLTLFIMTFYAFIANVEAANWIRHEAFLPFFLLSLLSTSANKAGLR